MEKRVLIVDDEVGILLAFKKILGAEGLAVDTAQTIEEAECLLDTGRYDAVVADLRLTGVLGEEGLEVIAYVKEHGLQTKVVLVTGYGNADIERRAMELGADRYFEKPVSGAQLKEALRGLGVLA